MQNNNAEQLLEEYRDMVKSKAHLYYMLGGDIEDIIQEGMIGLYKAIKNYDEGKGASFKTFAELCVSRQIISAIKNSNRKKFAPLNTSVSLDKPVNDEDGAPSLGESLAAGTDSDPETMALLSEMTELLISPSSTILSDMERQVLSYLLNGYDYVAIAKLMDRTPKQIDNAMQRIRNKLTIFLEN